MSDASTAADPGLGLDAAIQNGLSAQEKARAAEIARAINVQDTQAVIAFGSQAQGKIASFSDTILSQIRAKDSGQVGQILSDLVVAVKGVNVDSLKADDAASRIPLLGGLIDSFRRFLARYEKLSVQIEKILSELESARMSLLKDITLLDSLYQRNLEYLKDLDVFIAAGAIKLEELRSKTLPEAQAKAQGSGDPLEAQKLQDLIQFIGRFEKKLHDLKLSRMVAIQAVPQIRLIQSNNQVLVEKIQSSIMNTIPLWKNQIVIAISLFRQKRALEVQRKVTDTTNDLLEKNSQMLKESTVGVAKENERGIVDIETLKKVNSDLISTIEDVLKIQEEGKQKRGEAELELARMEAELKQKLQDVRGAV
jgi:uncharacterized protein YaaN involved in tellurite resistance